MTETAPFLKPYVDALQAGEPLPPYARRELSFGPPRGRRRPGRVPGLGPAADGITGQAIGLGGDRLALWSHPAEAVVAFADGGWTRRRHRRGLAEGVRRARPARRPAVPGAVLMPHRPRPRSTAIDTHVHVESDGHGPLLARRGAAGRLGEVLQGRRQPHARPGRDRRVLPRAQLAAVVFTVDAHTATGHPALSSEADRRRGGRARRRADPVRVGRPARRRVGGRPGCATWPPPARAGSSCTRRCRTSCPTTARTTRCTRQRPSSACRSSSTPARPASAPGCPAAAGIKLRYSDPMLHRRRRRRPPRA